MEICLWAISARNGADSKREPSHCHWEWPSEQQWYLQAFKESSRHRLVAATGKLAKLSLPVSDNYQLISCLAVLLLGTILFFWSDFL